MVGTKWVKRNLGQGNGKGVKPVTQCNLSWLTKGRLFQRNLMLYKQYRTPIPKPEMGEIIIINYYI